MCMIDPWVPFQKKSLPPAGIFIDVIDEDRMVSNVWRCCHGQKSGHECMEIRSVLGGLMIVPEKWRLAVDPPKKIKTLDEEFCDLYVKTEDSQ